MNAKILGFNDLFDDPRSYSIHQFQFPCVWNDVRKIAERILNPHQEDLLPHFIGAIVLQSKDNEKTVDKVKRVLISRRPAETHNVAALAQVHAKCV